jgi:hypothetical protein
MNLESILSILNSFLTDGETETQNDKFMAEVGLKLGSPNSQNGQQKKEFLESERFNFVSHLCQ